MRCCYITALRSADEACEIHKNNETKPLSYFRGFIIAESMETTSHYVIQMTRELIKPSIQSSICLFLIQNLQRVKHAYTQRSSI